MVRSFREFQNRFTYRQRFMFFALVFVLGIPLPAYWSLRSLNYNIHSIEQKQIGIKYQKELSAALSLVIGKLIEISTQVSNPLYLGNLENIDERIEDKLSLISEIYLTSDLHKLTRTGNGFSTSSPSFNLESLNSLWKEILGVKQPLASSDQSLLLKKLAQQMIDQIKQIGIAFDLISTMNKALYNLIGANTNSLQSLKLQAFNIYSTSLKTSSNDSKLYAQILLNDMKARTSVLIVDLEEAYEAFSHVQEISASLYDNASNTVNNYSTNSQVFFSALQRKLKGELAVSSLNSLINYLESNQNLLNLNFELINTAYDHYMFVARIKYQLAIILLGLSIGVIAFYFYYHVLSHHFMELSSHIQDLGRGLFSKCFCSEAKDEFGPVGKAIDKMGQTVQDIVRELKKLGRQLSDAIEKITKTIKSQEGTVINQENSIKEIASTTAEIATHSRVLADTMNDLSLSSKENSLAEQAKGGLNHLRTRAGAFTARAEKITQQLENLLNEVLNMRSVIAFLTHVSDQAALLSLNAAIETTAVGPQKQSFLKITEEIQRFAEKTASSTKQIEQIIKEMSNNVLRVKSETKTCFKEMNEGSQRLLVVDDQLRTIIKQGYEQVRKFENVNDVMQVQALAAENIIDSISKLSQSAEANTQYIRQLYGASQQLGATAGELEKVLALFFQQL